MTVRDYNTTKTIDSDRSKANTGVRRTSVYKPQVPESTVGPEDNIKDDMVVCDSGVIITAVSYHDYGEIDCESEYRATSPNRVYKSYDSSSPRDGRMVASGSYEMLDGRRGQARCQDMS
jgi:hypothetical protein